MNKVCETEGSTAKQCTKCNIEKTIDEYSKKGKKKNGDIRYRSDCKACEKQYREEHKDKIKQRYQDNKEERCEYGKQYRENNKEELSEYGKQYRENNKDKIKQRYQDNKVGILEYQKQYYQNNKEEKLEYQRQYKKNKRATDLEFKLKDNIRTRINCAIHSQLNNGPRSGQKSARTHKLLGISMDKYIRWIEFQLKDGWAWDNWGSDFHIDHVYPIAKHDLSKKEEQFKAFNWKNTRPMCKKENMAKGDKIIPGEVFQHKVTVLAFLFHEINFKQ